MVRRLVLCILLALCFHPQMIAETSAKELVRTQVACASQMIEWSGETHRVFGAPSAFPVLSKWETKEFPLCTSKTWILEIRGIRNHLMHWHPRCIHAYDNPHWCEDQYLKK